MEKETWYLCDPEKNTECAKTHCAYNPEADYRRCYTTSRKEFARLDFAGQPCENPDANRRNETIRKELEASGQALYL
ncbi:MAG: hypothetical protein IJ418_09225 [Clostridia bacterium]|nr:hypothetical protein [Clostridia bacterium]